MKWSTHGLVVALVVVVISIIGSFTVTAGMEVQQKARSYCFQGKEAQGAESRRSLTLGHPSLSRQSRQLPKLQMACAVDPDDAECKELYERKKQSLEQLESEIATPFDLQEKLKAFGQKLDKKRKHIETVDEKCRKIED